MNLLMAATPIAMQQCRHPFESAALVLEWHVLGMFVPGFFTGRLIKRFGALPVMGVGAALSGRDASANGSTSVVAQAARSRGSVRATLRDSGRGGDHRIREPPTWASRLSRVEMTIVTEDDVS